MSEKSNAQEILKESQLGVDGAHSEAYSSEFGEVDDKGDEEEDEDEYSMAESATDSVKQSFCATNEMRNVRNSPFVAREITEVAAEETNIEDKALAKYENS